MALNEHKIWIEIRHKMNWNIYIYRIPYQATIAHFWNIIHFNAPKRFTYFCSWICPHIEIFWSSLTTDNINWITSNKSQMLLTNANNVKLSSQETLRAPSFFTYYVHFWFWLFTKHFARFFFFSMQIQDSKTWHSDNHHY